MGDNKDFVMVEDLEPSEAGRHDPTSEVEKYSLRLKAMQQELRLEKQNNLHWGVTKALVLLCCCMMGIIIQDRVNDGFMMNDEDYEENNPFVMTCLLVALPMLVHACAQMYLDNPDNDRGIYRINRKEEKVIAESREEAEEFLRGEEE